MKINKTNRKYIKCLSLLVINVLISNTALLAQGNLPFDPRGCSLNCAANDVDVIAAQLYSDAAGTIPLTSTCTSGSTVIAYLGITFVNNSNANRGVTALATDVYFNGVFNQAIKYCPSLILSGGQTKVFTIPIPLSWVCGEAIELRNIFGGWNVGGSLTACPSACKDIIASKCNDAITTITVLTPPTALFSSGCATPITNSTMSFVNSSTGGPAANLSYVWNFGDGSSTVTTTNPTHTFSGNGPYNVTLTVTNSVGTDTEAISVSPGNCIVQPVDLLSFNGIIIDEQINLNWKTANEESFSHFELQKSTNAKEFAGMATVKSNQSGTYNQVDNNPTEGNNYYRLKMVDLDGTSKLSKVITVKFEKGADFVIIENPASIGVFMVMTNLINPRFTLLTSLGSQVETKVIATASNQYTIQAKNTTVGIYYLNIESNGKYVNRKVLRQ